MTYGFELNFSYWIFTLLSGFSRFSFVRKRLDKERHWYVGLKSSTCRVSKSESLFA